MPDGGEVLFAARLKFARAVQLREEHAAMMAEYVARRPVRIYRTYLAGSNERRYDVEEIEPLPPEAQLLLGDAIHNLRTTLDVAIYEIVGSRTELPSAVAFPFARNEANFEETLKKRQCLFAGAKVQKILRVLKPYRGGNELLVDLHELDLIDKHRLILQVRSDVSVTGAEFHEMIEGDPRVVEVRAMILEAGVGIINRFMGPKHERAAWRKLQQIGKHEVHSNPTFDIRLGDGQPLAGLSVSEALDHLERLVREIIRAVSAAHLADLGTPNP